MRLLVVSEIQNNHPYDGYMGVDGINTHVLIDDSDRVVREYTSIVHWQGRGSPFPTPPGGPWSVEMTYRTHLGGTCLYVKTDRESEVFVHLAAQKSYGCLIVNPTEEGKAFFELILQNAPGLQVWHEVSDIRSEEEKIAFPIDYSRMGYVK